MSRPGSQAEILEQLGEKHKALESGSIDLAIRFFRLADDAFVLLKPQSSSGQSDQSKAQYGWGLELSANSSIRALAILGDNPIPPDRRRSMQFRLEESIKDLGGYIGDVDKAIEMIDRGLVADPTWRSDAARICLQLAELNIQKTRTIETREQYLIGRAHQLDPHVNQWMNSVCHVDLASQALTLEDAKWHLDMAFHLYEDFKPEGSQETPHFLISGLPGVGGVLLPLPEDTKTDIRLLKIEDCLRISQVFGKINSNLFPKPLAILNFSGVLQQKSGSIRRLIICMRASE